jgi:hypothetical protein
VQRAIDVVEQDQPRAVRVAERRQEAERQHRALAEELRLDESILAHVEGEAVAGDLLLEDAMHGLIADHEALLSRALDAGGERPDGADLRDDRGEVAADRVERVGVGAREVIQDGREALAVGGEDRIVHEGRGLSRHDPRVEPEPGGPARSRSATLGADGSHEGGAGVALAGAVVGLALAMEVGVALEGEVLVVADEVGDAGEAGDAGRGRGRRRRRRWASVSGAALEVADVLDADREVVEADAVAGHPGLGHQADDRAVAVDEEVGGDVEVAGAGDDLAAALDGRAIEVAPGAVERAAAGVVQDDDLRVDERVAGGGVLVALAVGDRALARASS